MAGVIDTAMDTVTLVAAELETQSLNSVVLRRGDGLDGLRSVGHYPGREGPQERWFPVRPHRPLHHSPFGDCLQGCLDGFDPCLEASAASLRGHPLIGLSFHQGKYEGTYQDDNQNINILFPFISSLKCGNAYVCFHLRYRHFRRTF